MNKKELDSMGKGVDDILIVNENNLENRMTNISRWYSDTYTKWVYELNKLNKIKIEKQKKYGELYDSYKYGSDKSWSTKSEIETQIHTEKSYRDLRIKFYDQQYIVDKLEGYKESIKMASFSIKNTLDYLKYKSGIF